MSHESNSFSSLRELLKVPDGAWIGRCRHWEQIVRELPAALASPPPVSLTTGEWAELRELLDKWELMACFPKPDRLMRQLDIMKRILADAGRVAHTVRIPFAGSNETTGGGFIAWLVLEVWEGDGSGEIAPHPENELHVRVGDDFRQSMKTAWDAARALPCCAGLAPRDGRWRIEGIENAALDGGSAGGAAALGWSLALRGRYPDPCLIVLAAIDEHGNLGEVDALVALDAKLQAIYRENRWDKVAVSTKQSREEIDGFPKTASEKELVTPDVVPVATLAELVELRSKYIAWLREETGWIEMRGLHLGDKAPRRLRIDELYIPLTFTGASSGERHTKAEPAPPEDPRSLSLGELRSHPRLVVIGDAGSGKSTFVKRAAWGCCEGELPLFAVRIRIGELEDYISKDSDRLRFPDQDPRWLVRFLTDGPYSRHLGLTPQFVEARFQEAETIVLLDGLDEAPSTERREVTAALFENVAGPKGAFREARFVLTTRPGAYHDKATLHGFVTVQVDALSDEAAEDFLRRWSLLLYPGNPSGGEKHYRSLSAAVHAQPEIRRLARNPLMLTAIAVVHWAERKLPEQRADLYYSIVKWLCEANPKQKLARTAYFEIYGTLALGMQCLKGGRVRQIEKGDAARLVARHFENDEKRALRFLEADVVDSGILASRGASFEFWHLTFQEYLAAYAIAGCTDKELWQIISKGARMYEPEWREVILLLGGVLIASGKNRVHDIFARTIRQARRKEPLLVHEARAVGLLGAMILDLRPVEFVPSEEYIALTRRVMGIFKPEAADIPFQIRLDAAEALGQAGDPRLLENNWVEIKACTFWMGAQKTDPGKPNYDPETADESPVHEVKVGGFKIMRYPVTVWEYRKFVEDSEYNKGDYWPGESGGKYTAPGDYWEEQLRLPNRPVMGVCWYEAAAYCKWLSSRVGFQCRLPSEGEWERVARGPSGYRYPWGNEGKLDDSRANFDANVGCPTPVGLYPLGRTEEGIYDMLGNVSEWCADWDGSYGSQGGEEGRIKALRGGAWDDIPRSVRVSYRDGVEPSDRDDFIGFRCAGELS